MLPIKNGNCVSRTPTATQAPRKPYLSIANKYLRQDCTAENTVRELANFNTPYGLLVAGEIALEAAWDKRDPNWLDTASEFYEGCKAVCDESSIGDFLDQTTADIRIAHIPTLKWMFEEQKLPNEETATTMYEKITLAGKIALDQTIARLKDISRDDYGDVSGKLGEISVLLLAQRYAIRSIGTDKWLPIQSTFSQDHGGNCLATSYRPSWDVSIITELDDSFDDPYYKLQVKRSNKRIPEEDYGSVLVCVYPDLALREGEGDIAEVIINHCYYEQGTEITNKERITKDLGIRTEKLLEIIDQ